MTLLKKIEIKNGSIETYEAPYNLSSSQERNLWATLKKPFFEKELYLFWKIYQSPLPNQKEIEFLTEKEAYQERKRFIRYPIIIGKDIYKNVSGGIWIDEVQQAKNRKTTATFHIITSPEKRHLAYPLLKEFSKQSKEVNYSYIKCNWGERAEENDPTNFFVKNGFEISKKLSYTSATQKLKLS